MTNSFDFNFSLNTRVKFGCGGRNLVGSALSQEKWQRVGLVVDHNLMALPIIDNLIGQIKKSVDLLVVGQCAISEPTYDSLEDLRAKICDPSLQAMIGVGGGSAMDMAKAMAVLVHNRKPAIEYRGFDKMTEAVLPVIAIPTTAGSGSEVTPNASFIDSREKKKMGINGEAVRPRYAFLDPELTLSCPPGPTVSAAADSIVHAVEAYVARKTNPMARLFAREGLQQVVKAVPRVVEDLDNLEWRTEVMYGAFLAGIALMHSGTGPAAAMSYPLGVHYQVAHGLGGAIFLPQVIEHNLGRGYTDYAELYDAITREPAVMDRQTKGQKFLKKIRELWVQLGITQDLQFCGFKNTAAGKELFINETLELKGALEQNPVPFGAADIEKVLLALTVS
jgi:alcohol dehydrogenase class IV